MSSNDGVCCCFDCSIVCESSIWTFSIQRTELNGEGMSIDCGCARGMCGIRLRISVIFLCGIYRVFFISEDVQCDQLSLDIQSTLRIFLLVF